MRALLSPNLCKCLASSAIFRYNKSLMVSRRIAEDRFEGDLGNGSNALRAGPPFSNFTQSKKVKKAP